MDNLSISLGQLHTNSGNSRLISEIQQTAELINIPESQQVNTSDKNKTPLINQYLAIRDNIIKIEESLKPNHEVAVLISSFNQEIVLNITRIGYEPPAWIHFYGHLPDGNSAMLSRNLKNIKYTLIEVPEVNPKYCSKKITYDIKPLYIDKPEW